ncbi:MAG: cation:proton antiporter [Acidobacteria bacterium]|nr:cation:proton antiporter [Acidobacteriota bacterium]
MWEGTFLRDLAVVLAASFPVLFLCRRLKLPQVVGFLVTGVAIGPHALGWVREARRVESLAEFGVALILLFVGLEFPIRRLKALGRTSFVGGSLQMALTAAAGFALARLIGASSNEAVFLGLLVSVSSTAVVLPILKQRDELAAPYGRRFLAVALFQDLAVIPILLFLPALVSGSGPGAAAVAGRVVLAIAGVALLVAVARQAAPRLLDAVARMGSRETFTGAVVVLVLAMVAAGEKAGVSAAMGAFAAGIVLGESDHVHEVAATLAPLHDLLSSLFFVSVGMLLEPAFLVSHPFEVGAGVLVLVAVKSVAAFAALRAAGTVPRTAARAALALANVGEFSFVLATTGAALGLLTGDARQTVVAATVGTLVLAPFLVAAGPALAVRLPEAVEAAGEAGGKPRARHIVVVGAGLNGTNVARVLQETGIPHVLVDIDPERIADARREGLDALRADATGPEGLGAAGVARALGLVVTIPDPDACRRVVRLCRMQAPTVRILVRTRYVKEVETLRAPRRRRGHPGGVRDVDRARRARPQAPARAGKRRRDADPPPARRGVPAPARPAVEGGGRAPPRGARRGGDERALPRAARRRGGRPAPPGAGSRRRARRGAGRPPRRRPARAAARGLPPRRGRHARPRRGARRPRTRPRTPRGNGRAAPGCGLTPRPKRRRLIPAWGWPERA